LWNKKEPIVKPEESFKVQKILDAIYESSRSGKEVRFDGRRAQTERPDNQNVKRRSGSSTSARRC
jgi:hypothetical protein